MSRSLNKLQLIGNVGNAPDIKYAADGMALATVSLATSFNRTKGGEKVQHTDWHRVKFFGKLAEIVGKHVAKGSLLYVEGRVQYGTYDKDGVKQYTTEIIADEMTMLSTAPAAA